MVNVTGLLAQLSLLAEGGGGHGIADFVLPTWIWTWILFGLVFFVLAKFAWKPLREQLEARENKIREAVDKAHQVKAEAEALLDKHQEMMDRAKADAQQIISEGREAGEKVREDAAAAGKVEAREIIDRAKKEIDLETKKAIQELRREAVDLSLMAASKILERSIEDEDHRKLAAQVIDEIAKTERSD